MVVCKTHFDVYNTGGFFIVDKIDYEQSERTSEQEQQQTYSSFHH